MSGSGVDLAKAHRRLVLGILAAHLPQDNAAWVLGSRATGRARPLSDLDLAIDAGRLLSLDETAELAEAFSDSDPPRGRRALPAADCGRAPRIVSRGVRAGTTEMIGATLPSAGGLTRRRGLR